MGAETHRDPAWIRGTSLWLLGVTGGLVVTAAYAAQWFSRPRGAIVAFVILLMGPFGHARLWLMRYLVRSFAVDASLGTGVALLSGVFDAAMVAQLLTARTDYQVPLISSDAVGWIGPVWFSSHAMIFLALVFAKPLRRARRWLTHLRLGPGAARNATEPSLERRDFLRSVGKAGVGLPFALSLSGVETSYDFQVEEREIELANWPPRLDGLRVAHLSDIHVGGAMDGEKLARVAELTNAASPDLVLYTGDFLTHRMPGFDEPLYEALATIRSPNGQWACLGNHDYDYVDRFVSRMKGCGVEVLRDRLTAIQVRGETVEIGGLDFAFYGRDRAARYAGAMSSWDTRSQTARILLCHDPSAFATLPEGCADLVLSGHTHGGHIGVQVGPDAAVTIVGMIGIPDQGIFERDKMKMYVTRCVGFYGYPIRLGIPPEIAILTLRSSS